MVEKKQGEKNQWKTLSHLLILFHRLLDLEDILLERTLIYHLYFHKNIFILQKNPISYMSA